MKTNREETFELGYVDVPQEYFKLEKNKKDVICLKIIDMLLHQIDDQVDPIINRIDLLDEIMESSIESNLEDENYEVAQVFSDIRKILNEPTD
jgi:hypothetical protein